MAASTSQRPAMDAQQARHLGWGLRGGEFEHQPAAHALGAGHGAVQFLGEGLVEILALLVQHDAEAQFRRRSAGWPASRRAAGWSIRRAASTIRARVSALTASRPFSTRSTVATETPAAAARSAMPGRRAMIRLCRDFSRPGEA